MTDLEWRDNNVPVSLQFDDPYFSVENGRAETSHVFIEGNALPARWPEMNRCTIAELGFGTGLNFLETVYQWINFQTDTTTLEFISYEQFPITQENMIRALSAWPELKTPANRLVDVWDPEKDVLDVVFTDAIRLTIHFGDANTLLPSTQFEADAWYLDGFSPAKNPELWNNELMYQVGQHCVADGTFATYTAAGFVKRNLLSAGFDVQKSKGFGRKRDMLRGVRQNDIDVATEH